MIAGLYGRILRKGADHVVVDVGGVRYLCHVALSTLVELGEVGQMAEITVYTHVREDAIQLFGFSGETEKSVFLALIGVSGVGPKLALTLLSGLPAAELAQTIVRGDAARLTMVPGVGKKTAERLIVELRDKLGKLVSVDPTQAPTPEGLPLADELASALGNLGYKPKQVAAVIEKIAEQADHTTPLAVLIRLALKELAK